MTVKGKPRTMMIAYDDYFPYVSIVTITQEPNKESFAFWTMEKNIRKSTFYDAQTDSLYIFAKKGDEENSVELIPGVNLELNHAREVIGIEILRASRFFQHLQPQRASSSHLKEPPSKYQTKRR